MGKFNRIPHGGFGIIGNLLVGAKNNSKYRRSSYHAQGWERAQEESGPSRTELQTPSERAKSLPASPVGLLGIRPLGCQVKL